MDGVDEKDKAAKQEQSPQNQPFIGPTEQAGGSNTIGGTDQENNQPSENKDDNRDTTLRGKLYTLLVASVLGIGGYTLSILWYFPFDLGFATGAVEPTQSTMLLIQYITLFLSAITLGVLYLHFSGRGVDYIDIDIKGRRQLGYLVVGILALITVLFAVSAFTELFQVESSTHSIEETVAASQEMDPRFLILMMGLSILVIGPSEEFIFRNLVQKRMYDSFSTLSSIGLSSILFALVHYPAYGTGSMAEIGLSLLTVFAISTTLGGIYAWTEDLVVVSLIHGIYNASIFGQWYLEVSNGIGL